MDLSPRIPLDPVIFFALRAMVVVACQGRFTLTDRHATTDIASLRMLFVQSFIQHNYNKLAWTFPAVLSVARHQLYSPV